MTDYTKKDIEKWVKLALENSNIFYKKEIKDLNDKKSGSVLVNLRGPNDIYNSLIVKLLLENDLYKNLLMKIDNYKEDEKLKYNVDRIKIKNNFADKFDIREKRLAICFYNEKEEREYIGQRLHYETPIRYYVETANGKKKEIREGAIDLVYQTSEYINLIELKSAENNETLLRALLEICTYYKKLNKPQFYKNFNLTDNQKPFQLCLLLEDSTGSYKDAKSLNQDYRNLFQYISNYLECPIKIYGLKKFHLKSNEIDDNSSESKYEIDNNDGKPILKDTKFEIEEIDSFSKQENVNT